MDPSLQIHFNPSCCGCDSDRQHTTLLTGAGQMTDLSAFRNKESPVTQICLFLIVVCIFSPFPSALPSVCRSFSLLFPSSHTVFCTLASFLLSLLSRHCFCSFFCCFVVAVVGFVLVGGIGGVIFLFSFFFYISVLPFILSTIFFSPHISANISISCFFIFFFSLIRGFSPPPQVSRPTQEPASHRKVPTFSSTLRVIRTLLFIL